MKHRQAQQTSTGQWGKIPTKYSIWVLLATVLLVIFATIGGKNLYFRGDYNIFLMALISSCLPLMKFKRPLLKPIT